MCLCSLPQIPNPEKNRIDQISERHVSQDIIKKKIIRHVTIEKDNWAPRFQ